MAGVLPSGLRDRTAIEAARVAAADWLPDASPRDFVVGALAGLDWVLGWADPPIADAGTVPSPENLARMEKLADDAIYRRPGAPELRRNWAVGVQHALMWARGATDSPPIDYE